MLLLYILNRYIIYLNYIDFIVLLQNVAVRCNLCSSLKRDDTEGTLLNRFARHEGLFGNFSSSVQPGFYASAFHHEYCISGSHTDDVWYRSLTVLLLLFKFYITVANFFGFSPNWISCQVTSAPVGIGLYTEMGQNVVSRQYVSVLYIWYDD